MNLEEITELQNGMNVEIMGIRTRLLDRTSEYNGKLGVLENFDLDTAHWDVRLEESGRVVHIRPENLSILGEKLDAKHGAFVYIFSKDVNQDDPKNRYFPVLDKDESWEMEEISLRH